MPKCPSCGYLNPNNDMRCPECGSFYSKVIELIEQEAVAEENSTLKGRCKRILNSGNIKQAFLAEVKQAFAGLTWQAKFSLFVVFVFVFALVVVVM